MEASGQHHSPAVFSPQKRVPGTHSIAGWVGPKSLSGRFGEKIKFLAPTGIRILNRSARIIVTIQTELPQLRQGANIVIGIIRRGTADKEWVLQRWANNSSPRKYLTRSYAWLSDVFGPRNESSGFTNFGECLAEDLIASEEILWFTELVNWRAAEDE